MSPHQTLDQSEMNSSATVVEATEALCQRVERRLRSNGFLALRGVTCGWNQGKLTLRGQVPTYYLKQLAQAMASQVEGNLELVNAIAVESNGVPRRRL
jgi:osmotically-inducible protein OsmY